MSIRKTGAGQARSTALIIGVLIIVVAVFALAKEFNMIDAAIAKRAVGISVGFIFIVTGNLLPKIVLPLTIESRAAARTKAAERFAGRIFVLAGIIGVGAWLFGPQNIAMLIASAIGLIAFLLAGAAWIWLARGAPLKNQQSDKEESAMNNQSSIIRYLMFAVFHTLIWVFAMFLADSIWGDRVSQGMVIPFAVANTILAVFLLSTISRYRSQSSE